ncbi:MULTISPECIES: UDP-N-acetylmuramoyl-tripeptide--D-alanyl-D-alanine ligase [unclassified Corynebacterium]|uniref:UDP-N-acetylmuramoyl-tripeptide--D-alanyl-D- alanine ligase n=1 Tax=unclassified Corynebacterium TaxID=2624378 RepID=UPI0029C9C62A|nr:MULTISPECIES: UDP-N-acetylmuramoyl-tripeptide--D-alanyl-D-alanine ligase [unclassified Corynebacterium]WPF65445.1 UDP-N-acetylmuramoyl-tripeptide--D-alanyl-D-alanine ligase [Corynebacterium sp. 22KM0430]WPF67941.1 UDP-N-acetylmuramoyl-tripeptide--D-alanyl-D-alanine ligase [Corynebacterium sp. 21KM1197]
MIPLSLAQIADIVGGELHDVPDPQAQVTGFVEFDSRKVTPGGLFVALPGARVDGHDYARTAVEAGAVAVLAARPVGVPAIVVKPQGKTDSNAELFRHDADGSAAAVVTALSDLARAVVRELSREHGLRVIGVTGSAGKTSTKDLIASVLRHLGPTVAPPGSFNNEIGHPYTALRCEPDTRFLVAEMSARGLGHIAHLAQIAPPHLGVELNVGSAHLGEFGSRENIAQAKGELVEALPREGVAILNADDDYVLPMARRTQARVLTFSAEDRREADLRATQIDLDDVARAAFTLNHRGESVRVKLQVFGAHQVSNALAAAAVGLESGLTLEQVAAALSQHVTASAHRMDVHTRADGVTVINDAYNANPDSMRAGIAALAYTASARTEARSVAVLGEMSELGAEAVAAHRELGREVARYHIADLVMVGASEACRATAEEAAAGGVRTSVVDTIDAAVAQLQGLLSPGDAVLVKASNSQGLWRVAERLASAQDDTRDVSR